MNSEKEQLEDEYETLKDRLYSANEKVEKIVNEKNLSIQNLKEDFG